MKHPTSFSIATLLAALPLLAFPGMVGQAKAQQEWEEASPYYEDDAWYDFTEWFDGNDYNPTDEAYLRWDDENYQAADDVGQDFDNDYYDDAVIDDSIYDVGAAFEDNESELIDSDPYLDELSDYGYDDYYDDDDWYFDYYDDQYATYHDLDDDGLYDYTFRYYDFDNDGWHDAYVTYYDWDDDGFYEDINYYSLNTYAGSQEQRQQAQSKKPQSSREQTVSGTIKNVKMTTVRDTQHMIVQIQREEGDKVIADLGPSLQLTSFDLAQGDPVSVRGPISKVGNRPVLIGQWIKANGEESDLYRSKLIHRGKVKSTKQIDVHGQKTLVAMLNTNRSGRNRVVDLGPAKKLKGKLSKGQEVIVNAIPARVKNTPVLMAQSISIDDKQYEIDRGKQQNASNKKSSQDENASESKGSAKKSKSSKNTNKDKQESPSKSTS